MSNNYKLKNGNYLKIEKIDSGYEYSLYDENKKLIDGGILEDLELPGGIVLKEILKINNISEEIEFEELDEEIEETMNLIFKNKNIKIPMTEQELTNEFWYGDVEKIKKYGYDMSRISGNLCDCDGNGRFVLKKVTPKDKKIRQKRYMQCKICGNYSHL